MKNTLHRAFVTLAATATLATAALAGEVTVRTFTGEASVPARPERIAVLDIAAADTLAALGVEIAALPGKIYVDYLDGAAAAATPVGTLFEPDFEALAALGPDLIIAGGRSAPKVEALSRIAPTIDMSIRNDQVLEQAVERLEAYGEITGLTDEAAALRAGFEEKIAATQAALAGKGNALILLTNGPKISAYGAGSRFGWIHRGLGLPEAREGLETQTHGEAVSFEFIAEVNPDWLIVVDRGAAVGAEGAAAAQTLDNELVTGTEAWKNGRVIYLDAARIYVASGGIQATSALLDQLTAAFGS